MAKITRTFTINAPVEKVFAFAAGDPTNLPKIYPSLIEVKDIKPLPAGGYSFNWIYKMAGMRFEGATETIEYIPNQRIATKTTKGIESSSVYTYESEDGGTKMTSETEYKIPVPLLGKLAEALILKLNENETNAVMANMKSLLED